MQEQLPSEEQLKQWWEQFYATGDQEAKNQILTHYIYLVVTVVKRMMPQYRDYCDKDDLVNTGMLGLIDAVEKFDPKFEVKFPTYATIRIRGEVLDYLRRQDWAPSGLRRKITSIQDTYEKLEVELNRTPSEKEVAGYLGISEREVIDALQKSQMFNVINLESLLFETEQEDKSTSDQQDPYHIVENHELNQALHKAIKDLPEKERMVIILYYYEGLTMKSIAKVLGVTESRVSQIHSKTLFKMRKMIKNT